MPFVYSSYEMPLGVFRGGGRRSSFVALSVGIVCGFSFAYLVLSTNLSVHKFLIAPRFFDDGDHKFHGHIEMGEFAEMSYHNASEDSHAGEDADAKLLSEKVRVLCWIMTNPKNHNTKARHVKATWGKRCNQILFMSSQDDKQLPTINLNISEGRDHLWGKTRKAFQYIYDHHIDKVDWVLKADDDTYVIVENLRYMLASYKPTSPIYFGCRFKPYVKQGYMSGGAGYVLSREATKRLVEKALPDENRCRPDEDGAEDVEIGKCLENVGVAAGDSRDQYGRGRFFPFVPAHHIAVDHTDRDFWYWKYIYYPEKQGLACCSDTAISFHYVGANEMYVLEYLIYHLRPYGINHHLPPPPIETANSTETVNQTAPSST